MLNIFSRTLLTDLPTYLIALLASFMRKVYQLKSWHESLQGINHRITPVFDLANCGPNRRFRTSTGLIVHNCLGLGYGMGAKKLVNTAYENGFNLSFKDAKAFFNSYWQLFSGVKALADRLAIQMKQDGYIVNEFGYRLTPEPRKAFNYFIQSSVSGAMSMVIAKIFAAAPWARFVTVIHDEVIASVPDERLEEYKQVVKDATDSLNADLGWTLNIRLGYAVGKTLYEAK